MAADDPGGGVQEPVAQGLRFGSGQGAELRVPMAVTVCAGLTSSTLLTLIVIPCVYRLVYRRSDAARGPEAAA